MIERPIPFTGEMVRAILDGRKNQTRRVISPQPPRWNWTRVPEYAEVRGLNFKLPDEDYWVKSKYGLPGDRLWVREAFRWRILDAKTRSILLSYHTDPDVMLEIVLPKAEWAKVRRWKRPAKGKWRGMPGMYMVRSMSRLMLEIADIRVERVQDISRSDAISEGIEPVSGRDDCYQCQPGFGDPGYAAPTIAFRSLWDSINAKRGLGWEVNPWVWAITFRRIK